MNKITEYQVFAAGNLQDLVTLINTAISIGWIPIGGVSFSPVTLNYFQSVVKYSEQ